MTKNVVPHKAAQVPANLASFFQINTEDLSAGVSGGFSVVSFRAGKWRIKHQGTEHLVADENGDARPSIEVVLLRSSKAISKIYYAKSYADGSADAPDCFSTDGITPDAGAASPQAAACVSCPHNQWGSKITPAGKKSKACSDHRRIAIAPVGDILNEKFGGSMLLRVPPASLSDLSLFGKQVAEKGYAYNAIVTRLGFDADASYPKLTFKAVRPLTEDELQEVVTLMQNTEQMHRILSEASELVAAPAEAPAPAVKAAPPPAPKAVDADFEMDEAPAAPQKPVAAPKPAKPVVAKGPAPKPVAAKPAPAPAPEPDLLADAEQGEDAQVNSDLDDILASLDSLG